MTPKFLEDLRAMQRVARQRQDAWRTYVAAVEAKNTEQADKAQRDRDRLSNEWELARRNVETGILTEDLGSKPEVEEGDRKS
jgi:hypothetical protein